MQTHPEGFQAGSVSQEAPLTRQACPECGGVMRLEQLGGIKQFTCHVGHRLGLQSMIVDKTDVIERAMWTVVAQSEELIELLQQAQQDSDPASGSSFQAEIQSCRKDMETVRAVVERRRSRQAEPSA